MNNIENTWKEIKSILTIKNISSDFPKCLSSNGSAFTNQVEISNIFNPNKAGLFEGSFSWGKGQFDPPPSHFEKNLSNIDNFIQLLNNLFKIC